MTAAKTRKLIALYYQAFNDQNTSKMLECLGNPFVHEVNQGERRQGKKKFAEFLEHMHDCYHEQLSDIVIMTNIDGSQAGAEFNLKGKYLKTDEGLPEANGQTYKLRVGAFFKIRNEKIVRVSTHYNLEDWANQVLG